MPPVLQVIKAADGSALLVMDRVDGSSLDRLPVQRVGDTMLRQLWQNVDRLHRARIAHRSLRAANIVVDRTRRPWLVDFSFSELGATQRQIALDVAKLLASLAAIAGVGRAVASAADVIGPDGVAAAVPLLQPLALSAGTRRAIGRHDGLLTATRAAAAAASGREDQEPARIQRVIPGLRSAAASLKRVAQNPGKMTMLFGGSVLITLAYIGAFAAAVEAFGGGPGVVLAGAVYLGASALAAAAPNIWGPRCARGGPGRGPDRCRHAGGTRRFRCAAVPAGHLLAPGGAGLAVLARAAAARVHVKPHKLFRTACLGLTVALAACTSPGGNAPSAGGNRPAGRGGHHGRVVRFPRKRPARRDLRRRHSRRSGSRCGSCRIWGPASWSIRR